MQRLTRPRDVKPNRRSRAGLSEAERDDREAADGPGRDRYRLQLEFAGDARQRLDELRAKASAATYAELIRDALRVYGWLLDKREQGYEVGLVKDNEPIRVIELIGV